MAAITVTTTALTASNSLVQWQSDAASLSDLQTLLGAANVIAPVLSSTTTITVLLNGVPKTVKHLDYVLYNTAEDSAVLTPEEYRRYYNTLIAPTLTVGTETVSTIPVTWLAIPQATNYKLEASATENGTYAQIYSGALLTYTLTGLAAATTRWFRIKAEATGYNTSAYSAKVSGVTEAS